MATRVYLCRHGESEASAQGRFCGRLDVGLSAVGVEQARALGAALADASLAAVYSSPLRRARETAALVAPACRLEVVETAGLAEVDFGELDGLAYDEASARFPDVYRAWLESPAAVRFPGGECFDDLRTRTSRALEEVVDRHPNAAVAVISHAGPLRAVLADALLVPDEALFRLAVDHASPSIVEWLDDGIPLVKSLNALPPAGLLPPG
jgi:ribonuclease H / adenosylcobalamin/alpha-ribazole phosphatase